MRIAWLRLHFDTYKFNFEIEDVAWRWELSIHFLTAVTRAVLLTLAPFKNPRKNYAFTCAFPLSIYLLAMAAHTHRYNKLHRCNSTMNAALEQKSRLVYMQCERFIYVFDHTHM